MVGSPPLPGAPAAPASPAAPPAPAAPPFVVLTVDDPPAPPALALALVLVPVLVGPPTDGGASEPHAGNQRTTNAKGRSVTSGA